MAARVPLQVHLLQTRAHYPAVIKLVIRDMPYLLYPLVLVLNQQHHKCRELVWRVLAVIKHSHKCISETGVEFISHDVCDNSRALHCIIIMTISTALAKYPYLWQQQQQQQLTTMYLWQQQQCTCIYGNNIIPISMATTMYPYLWQQQCTQIYGNNVPVSLATTPYPYLWHQYRTHIYGNNNVPISMATTMYLYKWQ